MKLNHEKLNRKKSWWHNLLTVFFVVYFAFFPNVVFRPRPVFALTVNAGSDFTLCTAGASFADNGMGGFVVTFLWIFDIRQNDYFDNDGLPLTAEGSPSIDLPVMAAATRRSYWLEVDDNSAFTSPVIQTGEVVSANQFYVYNGSALTADRTWFWRIMVKDSYDSQTDWVDGGSFSFGVKTMLKGKIKLKGDTFFKFP